MGRAHGRRRRVDANHTAIVEALRKAGYSVASTAMVGFGFPDIAVGAHGVNVLIEIKPPGKPSLQKLTKSEKEWHDAWQGSVYTVTSVETALNAIIDAIDIAQ